MNGALVMQTLVAASTPDWTDVVGAIAQSLTALALVVAGLWAVYNFTAGRKYKPRLTASIEPDWLVRDSGDEILIVRIAVKNTGSGRIILPRSTSGLRVKVPMGPMASYSAWERLLWEELDDPVPLLGTTDWIEPAQTIYQDTAIRLPADLDMVLLEPFFYIKQRRSSTLLAPRTRPDDRADPGKGLLARLVNKVRPRDVVHKDWIIVARPQPKEATYDTTPRV